jgi:hypothetical protein
MPQRARSFAKRSEATADRPEGGPPLYGTASLLSTRNDLQGLDRAAGAVAVDAGVGRDLG